MRPEIIGNNDKALADLALPPQTSPNYYFSVL